MRVLYIEPDVAMAQSVERMLKSEGFSVTTTDLGEEGISLAEEHEYDAILLELNVPDIPGLVVLQKLFELPAPSVVMVLTKSGSIESKMAAFDAGADDYLLKPFHKDELLARLRAITRRRKKNSHRILREGSLFLDMLSRTIKVGGVRVDLTPKESLALELLLLRKGRIVSREAIVSHSYGCDKNFESRAVDAVICRLRKKLKESGWLDSIETARGEGYIFKT